MAYIIRGKQKIVPDAGEYVIDYQVYDGDTFILRTRKVLVTESISSFLDAFEEAIRVKLLNRDVFIIRTDNIMTVGLWDTIEFKFPEGVMNIYSLESKHEN